MSRDIQLGAKRGLWHYLKRCLLAAILVAGGLGLHWWYRPSVPTLAPDLLESVEVSLVPIADSSDVGQDEFQAVITDPAQIQTLLGVFLGAERASEHKCGSRGVITIRLKDGTVEKVEILPGHDAAFYEYRYGSRINRVERTRLLDGLKTLGAKRVKLE